MMSDDVVGHGGVRSDHSGGEPPVEVTTAEFRERFGEDLRRALDIDTWLPGEDLATVFDRLDAEVRSAVEREGVILGAIRQHIFPELGSYPAAPRGAGVYNAAPETLARIHRGLLFNGGVEACDGTIQLHDTLPLTIYQVGVCLVSYQGHQGTWGQRLFRRDLRVASDDPAAEMVELLRRRDSRGGLNQPSARDTLTELARRGIMAYAERAILLRRSEAVWRMGHGNPAPYELITGSGNLDLMIESTKLIRELVEQHQKFVFVASEPSDRVLLTIGQALRPLEFAIVDTLSEQIERTVEHGHYRQNLTVDHTWDGRVLTADQWIRRFRDVIGPRVVRGVFRATGLAPAQVFYAHEEHAELAAHIALADSILQEHRGFPLLIDLANSVCASVFGRLSLAAPAAQAYANAGAPWRFLSERATRYD
jgi:hypothetical protein